MICSMSTGLQNTIDRVWEQATNVNANANVNKSSVPAAAAPADDLD